MGEEVNRVAAGADPARSARPGRERWLPVEGWLAYEVSDLGRVRSIDRILRNGRMTGGVILRQTPNPKGYPCVTLSDGWRRKTVPVYKLVKRAFTGPSRGRQVRHWDDDKQNNQLSNLRYGTQKQNERDKRRNREREEKRRRRERQFEIAGASRVAELVSAGLRLGW